MTEKFFKKKPEFDKSPIAGIQYEDNKTKNGEIVVIYLDDESVKIESWENISQTNQNLIRAEFVKNLNFDEVPNSDDK